MRAPVHWNIDLSEVPMLRDFFRRDSMCEGFVRRLYARPEGQFVAVGYYCDYCHEILLDDSDLGAEMHLELQPEDF